MSTGGTESWWNVTAPRSGSGRRCRVDGELSGQHGPADGHLPRLALGPAFQAEQPASVRRREIHVIHLAARRQSGGAFGGVGRVAALLLGVVDPVELDR